MSLSQAIKDKAHRLGFSLAGVTTPAPPPHLSVYENWLALGRNGSMDYLARDRAQAFRRDPRLILPECQSILVLAIRYPTALRLPPLSLKMGREPERGTGRVAAYAWGQDYHLALPGRLKRLVAFIEERVGSHLPHREYTDTGPVLERELAQRAGLGWIGKNTCLINPEMGSYLLLAEIFLGLELEPDPPFTFNRCGTCTRCIQACPTGCILPDRTLDARRCISYLTIENKGEIPPDLRPKMGNWVFGCDICQMVCPWNRFAGETHDPAFTPRAGSSSPNLKSELGLATQEFNRKFRDTPIQRARRRGYLRNVSVALGNSADASAISSLKKALQDDEPLIREHAAWAIEQIQKN